VPTYQYACTECGHDFEQFQSFSDDALTECPVCEGRLRKVFNAVGVVFKGSGFYRNDSRGSSTTSEPAASSGEKSGEKKSGETKSGEKAGAAASSSTTSSTTSGSSGSSSASGSTGS
jgi:putative FmdB family regulatory protein